MTIFDEYNTLRTITRHKLLAMKVEETDVMVIQTSQHGTPDHFYKKSFNMHSTHLIVDDYVLRKI